MQDSRKTFPSITFPQQFCIDCTRCVVIIMLSQTRPVCYDYNAVLNSLEMCVLNTQIYVAGKIACWSEWASWLSLGLVNKTAILLALEQLSSFHFQYLQISCNATNSSTFLSLLLLFQLFLFSLMMSCPSSFCNLSVSCSELARTPFGTASRNLPDSPEEA